MQYKPCTSPADSDRDVEDILFCGKFSEEDKEKLRDVLSKYLATNPPIEYIYPGDEESKENITIKGNEGRKITKKEYDKLVGIDNGAKPR